MIFILKKNAREHVYILLYKHPPHVPVYLLQKSEYREHAGMDSLPAQKEKLRPRALKMETPAGTLRTITL